MIQEFDLRNIVSSYSLHDCYISDMEFKDEELKFYIDELFPEFLKDYDALKDYANKFKSLIVTYKINDEDQCYVNVCKTRWFFKWPYHKIKTLELKDFVDYFKKVKSKKGSSVVIYYQLFTNYLCYIDMETNQESKNGWDGCDLHLSVEAIKYEWSEKSLDSLCKEIK